MNKPKDFKYKYGIDPSNPEYHKLVARRHNMLRTYKDQYDKWDEMVRAIESCIEDEMSHEDIVEEITQTTPYKLIKRGKEMKYGR